MRQAALMGGCPQVQVCSRWPPSGATSELTDLWQDGEFELIVCPQLIDEVRKALLNPRIATKYDISRIEAGSVGPTFFSCGDWPTLSGLRFRSSPAGSKSGPRRIPTFWNDPRTKRPIGGYHHASRVDPRGVW